MMKIGIYFTANKNNGGVYQYSVTFLEAFSKIKDNDYYIFTTSKDIPIEFRKLKNFHFIEIYSASREQALKIREMGSYFIDWIFPSFFKIIYRLGLFEIFRYIAMIVNKKTIRLIQNKDLDLMFYPTTSNLSFLINVPSVVTVHDLHHKLTPWFKETTAGGRREIRDYTFSNITKKSYKLLAESKEGKEDLIRFYGVGGDRVIILPMLPPSYLIPDIDKKTIGRFLETKHIGNQYLFYPAKFWPHKNHLRLIKALNLLKKEGIVLDLVLTGSKNADFSTYDKVMDLADELGVSGQIKYLGYVDDKTLSILYKGSLCLVMPTFFGATNLPVLEAWKVGTPVIYSDIRGCRNQLGDAGLLVDPQDFRDIAAKIKYIYNNPRLRDELIRKGKKRLGLWTEEKFVNKIVKLVEDYKEEQK